MGSLSHGRQISKGGKGDECVNAGVGSGRRGSEKVAGVCVWSDVAMECGRGEGCRLGEEGGGSEKGVGCRLGEEGGGCGKGEGCRLGEEGGCSE